MVSAYAVMQEYIDRNGGTRNMEIVFSCGRKSATMKLRDVKALHEKRGRLTSDLMNWFCTWYSTQIEDPDIVLLTPEISTTLKVDIQLDGEALGVLENFYKRKSRLRDEGGTTVVVPIGEDQHWSLVVVSNQHFLAFDSTNNKSFHGMEKLHRCIAKVWALHTGHVVGSEMWRTITATPGMPYWRHIRVPQQDPKDKWRCGWYTIRNILEYCSPERKGESWEGEVHIFVVPL
jgi:hypothetical protein